jgi:hypothetical protein
MDSISSLKRGKGRYIIHDKLAGQLSEFNGIKTHPRLKLQQRTTHPIPL